MGTERRHPVDEIRWGQPARRWKSSQPGRQRDTKPVAKDQIRSIEQVSEPAPLKGEIQQMGIGIEDERAATQGDTRVDEFQYIVARNILYGHVEDPCNRDPGPPWPRIGRRITSIRLPNLRNGARHGDVSDKSDFGVHQNAFSSIKRRTGVNARM